MVDLIPLAKDILSLIGYLLRLIVDLVVLIIYSFTLIMSHNDSFLGAEVRSLVRSIFGADLGYRNFLYNNFMFVTFLIQANLLTTRCPDSAPRTPRYYYLCCFVIYTVLCVNARLQTTRCRSLHQP